MSVLFYIAGDHLCTAFGFSLTSRITSGKVTRNKYYLLLNSYFEMGTDMTGSHSAISVVCADRC